MKKLQQLLYLIFFFSPLIWKGSDAIAQRGKDGVKIVTTANIIVNEYTTLTANAVSGGTTITVANSALNTNNRFPGNLAPGDLLMIIQIQGATILGAADQWTPAIGFPYDSTWGGITNYNNCGNWEFAEVYSISGSNITIDCPLTYNYDDTGRVEVVRVPRYSSLTINNGGSINCDPWSGTFTGGVCAIEVQNNTIINAGGSIDVSGNGFRGAQEAENLSQLLYQVFSASIQGQDGAEKGEGIAGYETDYTKYGGMFARGAAANAGGGANVHNCGGGGGGNGGNPLSWNGHGIPDNTGLNYNLAWNLQYGGFSTQISTGGGQGGYSFSSSNQNAITTGPNNSAWGGNWRYPNGGYGGRPLDYSTGRLFLGGGGGSGDQNNNYGGRGANGGALVYLMSYGTVSGSGQINSNGNNGANTTGAGTDGAGGAGAGGTVIVNSAGAVSGISINANGGKGGNQAESIPVSEAEGPGGGGGGGYIAISNGNPARTANGGANGTTNSTALTEFKPNGATQGDSGTTHATVTNFIINAPNVTICAGQSTTLNATLSGTVPPGTGINWYDNLIAGNIIGTGNTYTTTVLSAGTYTYYVGTCPGTYHQPVLVTATSNPVVSAGPDATICSSGSTTLNGSGGTSYSWSPATGLNNPNISNPVANPAATTTYVLTATTPCGNAINDTAIVTVNSSISTSISGNTTICSGDQTTLSAVAAGSYSWSTGASTSSITVSPTGTTNYSLTITNGSCTSTGSVTVTVNSAITAAINGPTAVCTGNSATLVASGGSNYTWSTGESTSSIVVSPSANTVYTVTVSNGNCSGTATHTVTAGGNLTAAISGTNAICSGGGSTTLTASGGTGFVWSTGETTASISVSTPGTYSVTVSSGSCSADTSVNVIVAPTFSVSMSSVAIQCGSTNGQATATVSGGIGPFTYLWNPSGASTAQANGLSAGGNYSVTVSDAFGCSSTYTVDVTATGTPHITISGNTNLCIGDATTLTASAGSGNSTYLWSNGSTATTITIMPSATTNYTVVATIGNCVDSTSFTVSVSPPPVAGIASSTTICEGQSATLTASPNNASYTWSNGATTSSITISPTASTAYSTTVSIGSCSDTASANIGVVPSPTATITSNPNVTTICGGDIITLNASGGTSYVWSNGAVTPAISVAPTVSTSYTVNASNNVCSDTATVEVFVLPGPIPVISGNNAICPGDSATLTVSSQGATYLWNTGATTAVIHPSTAGSYSVLATVGTCTAVAVTNLTVNPTPSVTVSPDVVIIQGQSTDLNATGGTNYVWNNGMNGASITVAPQSSTNYCVTVYDANNCHDTACVTVTVELCSSAGTLYLPNAFSPNGDGKDDSLQIYYGIPKCIKDFRLYIYNRWGEKIFETTDPAFRWDGIYNKGILKETGEANTEVFTYFMDVTIMDGTHIARKGNISLVR